MEFHYGFFTGSRSGFVAGGTFTAGAIATGANDNNAVAVAGAGMAISVAFWNGVFYARDYAKNNKAPNPFRTPDSGLTIDEKKES